MEGWRLGSDKKEVANKNKRTDLTPTGLLMEGDYTHNSVVSEMAVYQ
jgi:hypothetical protein